METLIEKLTTNNIILKLPVCFKTDKARELGVQNNTLKTGTKYLYLRKQSHAPRSV